MGKKAPMSPYACFFWGALGGVFLELIHWYSIRTKPHFPTYFRSPQYWLVTIAMIAFGGLIAVLIMKAGKENISEINAFALGFMAPSFQTHLKKFMVEPTLGGVVSTEAPTESFGDFLDW